MVERSRMSPPAREPRATALVAYYAALFAGKTEASPGQSGAEEVLS